VFFWWVWGVDVGKENVVGWKGGKRIGLTVGWSSDEEERLFTLVAAIQGYLLMEKVRGGEWEGGSCKKVIEGQKGKSERVGVVRWCLDRRGGEGLSGVGVT